MKRVGALAQDLDAVAGIAWVVLAAVVLWFVLPELRRIIKSRDFSIEIAGMKLSAQGTSEQLVRQVEDLQNHVDELNLVIDPAVTTSAQRAAARAATDARRRRGRAAQLGASVVALEPPRLLWVDDQPSGNAFEIKAFQDQGWDVTLSRTTADALTLLAQRWFDVVISDGSRIEKGIRKSDAGAELLASVRDAGHRIPILIYTSTERERAEGQSLLERGANFVTSSPAALRREVSQLRANAFTAAVAVALEARDFRPEPRDGAAVRQLQMDFLGRVGPHLLAIEAVLVTDSTRLEPIHRAAAVLLRAREHPTVAPDDLIIVAPHPMQPSAFAVGDQKVRVMGLEEFDRFLDELMTRDAR